MLLHFVHIQHPLSFIYKQISTTGLFLSTNCNHRSMGLTHQALFDRRNVLGLLRMAVKIGLWGTSTQTLTSLTSMRMMRWNKAYKFSISYLRLIRATQMVMRIKSNENTIAPPPDTA